MKVIVSVYMGWDEMGLRIGWRIEQDQGFVTSHSISNPNPATKCFLIHNTKNTITLVPVEAVALLLVVAALPTSGDVALSEVSECEVGD